MKLFQQKTASKADTLFNPPNINRGIVRKILPITSTLEANIDCFGSGVINEAPMDTSSKTYMSLKYSLSGTPLRYNKYKE